jgi:hypothetical protein
VTKKEGKFVGTRVGGRVGGFANVGASVGAGEGPGLIDGAVVSGTNGERVPPPQTQQAIFADIPRVLFMPSPNNTHQESSG